MPSSSISSKKRDAEALSFFDGSNKGGPAPTHANAPLGSTRNPIVLDSPSRPTTPTTTAKRPLEALDVNSPLRAKIARGYHDAFDSSPEDSPIVYRRIPPNRLRRITSPSPSPSRQQASIPSGSTSAPNPASSAFSASHGLVDLDYWSDEPVSETLSKGELLRYFRVLDRARVALHGKLPNLDDLQREATQVMGHDNLFKLFNLGFMSKRAFDEIRRTGYVTPEALADADMVEVGGDPTEIGIYEDTGKVGEPFAGSHAGYTGSGSGTQKRCRVDGVRVAGVRARVLGEHENEDYRAKCPCPHYDLGYDNSGTPHLYLWWWRMSANRYDTWLRNFFPDEPRERFSLLRVAVVNIVEALFIQMLGRYKLKTIEELKIEERVLVVNTPYRGLNRATALARSGDFITSANSFPMREKGRYAMAEKRGISYQTGDKWDQDSYNVFNSGGSYLGFGLESHEQYKSRALREWLSGAKQRKVNRTGYSVYVSITTSGPTLKKAATVFPLLLGPGQSISEKSFALYLPFGAYKFIDKGVVYQWRLHAPGDTWSPETMHIDVSENHKVVYSFGKQDYVDADENRRLEGVKSSRSPKFLDPLQMWTLVCTIFKLWAEGSVEDDD